MQKNNDYFIVQIINWDKYQVRKDLKSMNFFRVQSNIFSDQKFMQLTQQAKIIWFYLLAEAGRSMSAQFRCYAKQVSLLCRVKPNKVRVVLSELEQFQLVNIVSRNESVPRVEKSRVEKSRVESFSSTSKVDKPKAEKFNIDIFGLWNEKCKSLPTAKALTEKRKGQIKNQLKKYPELDHWEKVIEKFTSSEFCLNNWRPTFDDFLSEPKRIAALEGRYDNKQVNNSDRSNIISFEKMDEIMNRYK